MGVFLIVDYFECCGMVGFDYVVVSLDYGGVICVCKLVEFLKIFIVIIDKCCSVDKMNISEVMNIIGKVEGKICILIDDMIDIVGMICYAVDVFVEVGVVEVYVSCMYLVLFGLVMDNI